jgi:type II secretory pathway pseudopilin PulG
MRLRFSNFRRDAAFTMVEIALSLAIVGFALVAIIGVLPAGLNVQKENREDTILNQDATVWLDAIRSGAQGRTEHLADYVDRITVDRFAYDGTSPNWIAKATIVAERVLPVTGDVRLVLTNDTTVVGLLSTPKIQPRPGGGYYSNYVAAFVRAFSGNASQLAPQDNADVKAFALGYRMVVEVTPVASFDPAGIRTNRVDGVLHDNLADVRLLFRWPLKKPFVPSSADDPLVGNSRMVFRTQISGRIEAGGAPFYYLQPRDYTP